MRTKMHALLVSAMVLLGGCASPVFPLVRPPQDAQAEVVIFRVNAFGAGGVPVTVGANGKAFVNLSNDDKAHALLPVGEHEIFVQARTAQPTRLKVALTKGAVVCLRTSSSPSTYAKATVPIALMVSGYHFYLDQVPCPASAELAKYKDVGLTYQ